MFLNIPCKFEKVSYNISFVRVVMVKSLKVTLLLYGICHLLDLRRPIILANALVSRILDSCNFLQSVTHSESVFKALVTNAIVSNQ